MASKASFHARDQSIIYTSQCPGLDPCAADRASENVRRMRPVKIYHVGEAFFEPLGSEHLISENASNTQPATMLAVFVADDGAQLTTFDP